MTVARKNVPYLAGCLLLLASAPLTQAQLLNPSFETAGSAGAVFGNWIDFGNGGNISRATEAVRTGTFSAKMFGQFTGDFNVSGFFQDRPTQRDQVWDASAYFQHLTGDALGTGNSVVMNVEFRASNGDLLEFWSVDAITPTTPRDVFIQRDVQAVAPDDAVVARIVFLFLQPDLFPGAGHIDDASLTSTSTSSGLINPGFEDFGGFGAAQTARGWGQFPRFATNIFRNSDVPRTGGFAGFMFGQFNGSPNFQGFYQTFDVAPGQNVDAEVFALHKGTDALGAGNFGFINLEFMNASGGIIGDILSNPGLTPASPVDTYIQLPVSGVAPAGATKVRVVIGMAQQSNGAGGIHFDDATVAISSPPTFCLGDANGDGSVNFADITAVLGSFGASYVPGSAGAGDANNDGIVNFADITAVLGAFNLPCP